MNQKVIFYEKISKQTEKELDDFLKEHPSDIVSYQTWKEARALSRKIFKERKESMKEYSETFDKIVKNAKFGFVKELTFKDIKEMAEINKKLSQIVPKTDKKLMSKIDKLNRKNYYVILKTREQ